MTVTISQLKTWFGSLKKPTGLQFSALIDSFYHKDEPIPIGAVQGLVSALDSKQDANQDLYTLFSRQMLLAGVRQDDTFFVFQDTDPGVFIVPFNTAKARIFGTVKMAAVDGTPLYYLFGAAFPTCYITFQIKTNAGSLIHEFKVPVKGGLPNTSMGSSVGDLIWFDSTFDLSVNPGQEMQNYMFDVNLDILAPSATDYAIQRRQKIVKLEDLRGFVSFIGK